MLYISKQKFNLTDLVEMPKISKKVLLVVNEEYLRSIYHNYLSRHDFEVSSVNFGDPQAMTRNLHTTDMLVLELKTGYEDDRLAFLNFVARDFPKIAIITIGQGLSDEILSQLMSTGIVGHLDRRLTRPFDLITLAKTFLKN